MELFKGVSGSVLGILSVVFSVLSFAAWVLHAEVFAFLFAAIGVILGVVGIKRLSAENKSTAVAVFGILSSAWTLSRIILPDSVLEILDRFGDD